MDEFLTASKPMVIEALGKAGSLTLSSKEEQAALISRAADARESLEKRERDTRPAPDPEREAELARIQSNSAAAIKMMTLRRTAYNSRKKIKAMTDINQTEIADKRLALTE